MPRYASLCCVCMKTFESNATNQSECTICDDCKADAAQEAGVKLDPVDDLSANPDAVQEAHIQRRR